MLNIFPKYVKYLIHLIHGVNKNILSHFVYEMHIIYTLGGLGERIFILVDNLEFLSVKIGWNERRVKWKVGILIVFVPFFVVCIWQGWGAGEGRRVLISLENMCLDKHVSQQIQWRCNVISSPVAESMEKTCGMKCVKADELITPRGLQDRKTKMGDFKSVSHPGGKNESSHTWLRNFSGGELWNL